MTPERKDESKKIVIVNPNDFPQWFAEIGSTNQEPPLHVATPDGLSLRVARPENLRRILTAQTPFPYFLLLLSGTSESGKSYMGRLLLKAGVASRIKLLRVVRELQERGILPRLQDHTGKLDPNLVLNDLVSPHYPNAETIFAKLKELITETPIAVVETIKHPLVIETARLDDSFAVLSIFIDASRHHRLEREAAKTGKSTLELNTAISKKDREKAAYGNTQIERIADLVIINNGTLEAYDQFCLALGEAVKTHTRQATAPPFEYL